MVLKKEVIIFSITCGTEYVEEVMFCPWIGWKLGLYKIDDSEK